MAHPKLYKDRRSRIPTPTEANISKSVIEEYEEKIEALQVDIDEFRKKADQLEERQNTYRRRIRKTREFISVARRLPPELLEHIFFYRVDGGSSYKLAIPMRVCKSWYHVVTSCCARLWSVVRLDRWTRDQWWNGALGSPTVLMPSTTPVIGYLHACITYSRKIPLKIYINLEEFGQSLGAGPCDPNAMNILRCLHTLIGENGEHLPRWQSLTLDAGARVNLDEDILRLFYQEIPNLLHVHLQNFSDLAFPRFKSLPSLIQYSRGGHSGSHDIDSIHGDDRGKVTSLQTFITVQEWTRNDYRLCQAFQNITILSLVNPRPSSILCIDTMELSLPNLGQFHLEGLFDYVFLSELHLPKLVSFLICANEEGFDPLEDVFLAEMELPNCIRVVWRTDQRHHVEKGLRQRISRLFEYFKSLRRLDLEAWVEPLIPPEDIEKMMRETGAWIGRKEPMLITYCEEVAYKLNPPDVSLQRQYGLT